MGALTLVLFNDLFAAVIIFDLQRFSSEPGVLKDLERLKEQPTTPGT